MKKEDSIVLNIILVIIILILAFAKFNDRINDNTEHITDIESVEDSVQTTDEACADTIDVVSNEYYTGDDEQATRENPVETKPTKHTRTVPVQKWKQCMNCFGGGQCPWCYGQGHVADVGGERVCGVCTGGRCSMCAGQGGHYEIEYETITEYY